MNVEKESKENDFILNEEERILLESAELASSKAVRSSLALGLSIKYIEKGAIVEYSTSGGKVIKRRKMRIETTDFTNLKKGMTLRRK